ncbi:MAG: oligosaccharide flippase family protein [Armatimonadetes bacterium]|nr:oligosaccharide flippase family protein [Armatimonadota bacterium]
MSRAERTVKDTAKLYGSQLAAGAFAVVFSAWLARNLPSAELSLWPVCITLAAIVHVLSGFGLGDLFVRLVPSLLQDRKRREAGALLRTGLALNVMATALITGLVVVAAKEITALLLHNEVEVLLVQMLGAAVLFSAMYKHLERALYAVQEFGKAALIRLVSQICRPSLAVVLYLIMGIKGAILVLSAVPFIAAVAAVISLWPYLTAWGHPHRPGHVIREALPFYGASLANLGTTRLDYVIVGALTTPAKLAAYYVARKLADYLLMLDTSVIEAITPKLAEYRQGGQAKIEDGFTRCWRHLFLGLLPLHAGIAVTAGPIVALYAGDRYPGAGPIMSLLAMAFFVGTIAGLHRAHVKVFANRWRLAALDGTAGVTSVGLSALFVLWLGAIGVPLAQSAAAIAKGAVAIVLLRGTFIVRYDGQAAWLGVVGSGLVAAVGLACVVLIPDWRSLPAALVLGAGVYFAALVGRLKKEDTDLLLHLIPFRFVNHVAGLLRRPAVESSS